MIRCPALLNGPARRGHRGQPARDRAGGVREVKNGVNEALPEKIQRGILEGLRNISDSL